MSDTLPKGWKWVKLGEIAEIKGGKRLPKGILLTTKKTPYPYIRITDFKGHKIDLSNIMYVDEDTRKVISKYTVNKQDIILSTVGTFGLCAIVPNELDNANLTENCVKFVFDKTKIDTNFLYYHLISPDTQELIKSLDIGSTQPKLPIYNIQKIDILLPPIHEQKAIAEVLSSLDDKIDLLHRQNKTLEEMAMTLFRQWFIEPTKDGLPEGWEIGKFGENLKIVYGKNLPTSKLKDSGYPVFGANGKIGYYIEYMYEEPQVLISCRGTAGKVNISDPKSYITNNSFVLERTINENISFEYLKYYCLNYDFTQFVTGSVQPQITIEELNNAEILIPPSILINKFSKIISNFETKIFSNKAQIQTLEKLRDTLLPKLMSGEVRVKV